MGELFTLIFKNPTINLLVFFYQFLNTLHIPGAFGFSIILLTVSIRVILHPFFKQQIDLSYKMNKAKPHLDEIQKKHKDDKKKLQEEQMKLYKEMGINPASGCLFAIVQIPVFIALYQVLYSFFEKGKMSETILQINKALYFPAMKIHSIDTGFFGLNLAATPAMFSKYGYYYLLIPVITAILQYYQIALSTPQQKPAANKEKKGGEDMQQVMSSQMKLIFPVMIGYFSYTLPVGLSVYWNIFSIFSIWQYKNKKS
ncbi:hypothetical protein A3C23_01620 [Candidatus Roizmanbacteria bacterium RIFCSPHIGHO2_02_FULL_37_13b]|uniref:Membrane insertase YidC/Oxa/ALB C-terminal domain-containing protein n=1 Tax=Candidatus Roizmanbacteria bacterium RIFCSPLOWO2_02_FULL_36_11 TaxID=1802071 RepID=A0A1F7JC84_9BACT|nr:MAG: hypothetical protein A3C23_01620 [Candidatus Roizmanbacteria bacterium RIFCSPHIGHO2_02_FULL_37_13b]OGK53214.1 MAG: hypothetical protein A3H78_02665 [Candidatus Roizmanbacteria bacterium RIFCSPLOWO2_02_FULL_36_11]